MILSTILSILLFLLGPIILYFLIAFISNFIPVNEKFKPPLTGIELHLSTNGMHTDFILPAKNEVFDWTSIIEDTNFELGITKNTYLGIGWGDKAVHLDIGTWSELTIKMGLATLFLPTPTILHITAYNQLPFATMNVKKTLISETQYLQLCQYIIGYFKVGTRQKAQLIEDVGYTPNDIFYQAVGKYHAFATCNTWVNKGLKKSGVRAPLWSPLDKGIFYQFGKIHK